MVYSKMNSPHIYKTKKVSEFPFKISAPAMIYGDDMIENVRILGRMVDNVEIVLFYTPTLNNFPNESDAQTLYKLGQQNNITFTVHLPAHLEIATSNDRRREESVRMAIDLIQITATFNPVNYVLHIPYTRPTLAPVPGSYFQTISDPTLKEWMKRALESLDRLQKEIRTGSKLLLENINYSPTYLQPFLVKGAREICLDMGHLLLGHEKVIDVLEEFLPVTKEIHLHGVMGFEEHLGLGVLPEPVIIKWLACLGRGRFKGIVNLEVFDPEHLETSLDLVTRLFLTGR